MRVLVVGNGGREHTLAWKIRQSPLVTDLFCAPGNAGMAKIADCVDIESSSIIEVADFASKLSIELTVVGPELALSLGIADEFANRGLTLFGPSKAAAEIETSKVFAKNFMKAHGIPTPEFQIFSSESDARTYIKDSKTKFPLVVKADGLCAGKGVRTARTREEALQTIDDFMVQRIFGQAGNRVIVEEFVEGSEVTFMALTDGKRVLPLASSQDYKRAYDGDEGPNTGGTGSLSPARTVNAEVSKQILTEIVLPTITHMNQEGRTFKGVIYAGLMITQSGPKVLEFNARFGDPEIQSVLPRLQNDLVPLLVAAASEKLEQGKLEWRKEHSVSVVVTSQGYPGSYETGKVISGLDKIEKLEHINVFHAGTAKKDSEVVTCGGRVLAVNSCAATLPKAADQVYQAIELLRFDGMYYRKDIGRQSGEQG
jgi:phosphoribosylamine--glycine ligase